MIEAGTGFDSPGSRLRQDRPGDVERFTALAPSEPLGEAQVHNLPRDQCSAALLDASSGHDQRCPGHGVQGHVVELRILIRPIPPVNERGEVSCDELSRSHIRVAADADTTSKGRSGRRAPVRDPRGTIEANTCERTQSRDRHISACVARWRDSGRRRDLMPTSTAGRETNQESYDTRHKPHALPTIQRGPNKHVDITHSDARPCVIVHRWVSPAQIVRSALVTPRGTQSPWPRIRQSV